MARKSITKNYIYNLLYQILVIVTPLITAPLLSRVLGADGSGTASFIESVVSYFSLFATMGMTTFGQREISYVQDDKEKRTIIFWEIVVLQSITTFIASIAYVIFSLYQSESVLYLVLIFNIFSVAANVTWLFQGVEEFGKIVLRNVILKSINIAYIFIFIHTKDDLVWYMLGHSLCIFLSNVSLWVYLPQYVGKPNWKEIKPFRNIGVIISLFIPTIAVQIYTVLDKTMIGVITHNSFENGYYEQAMKISKLVMTIVTALGTVMIPRIGYEYEGGNDEEVRRLMYYSYRFVWFLGVPLCIGLSMVASNFIPWFLGDGYDEVIPLLRVLSPIIIAIGVSSVTGTQYLIPTKRENTFTLTVVIGAIMNFLMNLVLIRNYQSKGAATASIATEAAVAIIQLYIVRKELNIWFIIKDGLNYYIAGGVMGLALSLIVNRFSPTFIHTIILVAIGAVTYGISLVLLKDELLLSVIKQALNIFKKILIKIKKHRKQFP